MKNKSILLVTLVVFLVLVLSACGSSELSEGDEATVVIPEWLAMEKGLI